MTEQGDSQTMERTTLTLEEVHALVIAKDRLELAHAKQQLALLDGPDNDPVSASKADAFQETMKRLSREAMNSLAAQHLFHNDASGAALVSGDGSRAVEMVIQSLKTQSFSEFEWSQIIAQKEIWTAALEGSIDSTNKAWGSTSQDANSTIYEYFWRWVEIVQALAAKYQLSTERFLERDDAHDHITRQLYTREQFIHDAKRALETFTGEAFLKALAGTRLADIEDPEKKELARVGLRNYLTDELERYYASEVARIYGGS